MPMWNVQFQTIRENLKGWYRGVQVDAFRAVDLRINEITSFHSDCTLRIFNYYEFISKMELISSCWNNWILFYFGLNQMNIPQFNSNIHFNF